MSKTLFNDFEGVTSKAWKQKIQVDLKGADYNDTLIWKTHEGIDVKPFYHPDEFDNSFKVSKSKSTKWRISQTIHVLNEKEANRTAIEAIERGAENIFFLVDSEDITINNLLVGIDLSTTTVDIYCNFILKNSSAQLNDTVLHCDIINNIAKTGNWYTSINEDHSKFNAFVKTNNQLTIDTRLYQNSGANIVQQLAYSLAHSNEYLNHLKDKLSANEKTSLKTTFLVSVGSNYFFEIAKLRALRVLWETLAIEYNINSNCRIIASPSKRNKTIYDYNVNMLRSTTECMSAMLGGADVVSNTAYDNLYHKSNEFGDRIARNQLLILKNESYFNKVNNPTDGAYYIESLTSQLAEKALDIFKDIESNGGFLNQLKKGTIQRKIKESAAKEQADFDDGKLVLLGTNKHPNPNDKMKNELEISPFLEVKKRKTLIEPIIEKRLSEKLEMNRLKEE
jgi:methylmalonyl-CoA mutase